MALLQKIALPAFYLSLISASSFGTILAPFPSIIHTSFVFLNVGVSILSLLLVFGVVTQFEKALSYILIAAVLTFSGLLRDNMISALFGR